MEEKGLYNENLKKEFVKDTRRQKDFLCLWISRINIVEIAILSKAIIDSIYGCNPYKKSQCPFL
jgi:hypothetical protein